jgi:ABC-2 type transport system permease protein
MTAHLRVALSVLKRDFLVASSYRVQFFTGLAAGFANIITFYYISRLVTLENSFTPDEYFAFVIIGVLIFTVITATLTTPHAALRQELVAGTFERLLLAPRGAISAMVALLLFPVLYALLTVSAMLVFAAAVFDVELRLSTLPAALPLALLAILAFAPFGILLQAAVVIGKKAPPGTNYLILGIALISGLYFPVTLLPDWVEWMSEVQPFTPAVDSLRWSISGRTLPDPVWLNVLKLLGFAAVMLPLALAALAAMIRHSRRRGTILEF